MRYKDLTYNSSYVAEFEKILKDFTGAEYVIATNSGTSALFLALKALKLRDKSRIITQAYSFVATANAITHSNMTPMFCDVDNHLCLDADSAKELLRHKPKAIVCAHIYGSSCDMDKIKKLGLPIVEDAAQGFNCYYKGKHLGTIGDVGALSFNGGKLLFTGGGGALLTNRKDIYEYAQHISTTAKDYSKAIYYHDQIGYNLKMTGVVAKFAIEQFKKLKKNNFKKKQIVRHPYQNIANFPMYKGCIRTNLNNTDNFSEHGSGVAYEQ